MELAFTAFLPVTWWKCWVRTHFVLVLKCEHVCVAWIRWMNTFAHVSLGASTSGDSFFLWLSHTTHLLNIFPVRVYVSLPHAGASCVLAVCLLLFLSGASVGCLVIVSSLRLTFDCHLSIQTLAGQSVEHPFPEMCSLWSRCYLIWNSCRILTTCAVCSHLGWPSRWAAA